MRTSYKSVSSARRLSSWLMVVLGLAAYVGLIYGLTVLPLQFEVPLPHWATFLVPAIVYGLLVLLVVRRPSVLRWIVGTAVLTGLHVLLGLAREPLTTLLDPALAGRPLPWMLPPPLPELVGVFLLLVPLRDVLSARPRLARERTASARRAASSVRGRAVVTPRLQQTAPTGSLGSLTETLAPERSELSPEPLAAPVAKPAPTPVWPVEPVPAPAPVEEPRRRGAAALAGHQPEVGTRPPRRFDVMLRIALDRIMDQLPPGTFLAPEDEVAASLRDPGYLLIPGELVVTQLSEGVARVAWSDIVDQFPPQLVGLGSAEISEHLGDGLRLPLDEVVGQLPHELFVADTPEVRMPGLDRIPVPFHPMEESTPAPGFSRPAEPDLVPAPPVERLRVVPDPVASVPSPAPNSVVAGPHGVEARPAAARVPEPVPPPIARADVDQVGPVTPAPASVPAPAAVAARIPEIDGPTVRISFARVAAEIPADAFRAPLEQVAERMRQPGVLLIPQSLVLSQLAEGLVQASWEVVAPQFPRDLLTVSDVEMTERLPHGIRLPLDEVVRQVPPDLFTIGGLAADVRGLESFPAPFQPLVSDPAPEPPAAAPVEAPVAPVAETATLEPEVTATPEPITIVTSEVVLDDTPAQVEMVDPEPSSGSPESLLPTVAELEPIVVAPDPIPAPTPVEPPEPSAVPTSEPTVEPGPVRLGKSWPDMTPPAPIPMPGVAGPAETAEARRIVALLAPIASFEVSIQSLEGVTVFAMAAPAVAQETAAAVAGLALPLLTDRRAPWPLDQITLRGPDTALVLTPLGGPGDRGSVLATAAPRGGGLALLEILCRRAVADRPRGTTTTTAGAFPGGDRGLVPTATPAQAVALASSLHAFGAVTASLLRDAGGEGTLYFFLPAGANVPAVAAFVQDLQAVMRKAAGSGAVFRTAVLRSGNTMIVIQPEEVGHGRSTVVVAGGEVTRPGLAYRQVARATAALVQA